MIGLIPLDIYNLEIAVFDDEDERQSVALGEGCIDPVGFNREAIAACYRDVTESGAPRFSLVIKPHAGMSTWAHECSHMADMICDYLDMPISLKATEVRAYLVGYIFGCLQDLMGSEG